MYRLHWGARSRCSENGLRYGCNPVGRVPKLFEQSACSFVSVFIIARHNFADNKGLVPLNSSAHSFKDIRLEVLHINFHDIYPHGMCALVFIKGDRLDLYISGALSDLTDIL
jgi:hypothetical protein